MCIQINVDGAVVRKITREQLKLQQPFGCSLGQTVKPKEEEHVLLI